VQHHVRRAIGSAAVCYLFIYLFVFYLFIYLFINDSFQANYLNIFRTDLRQIRRVGRTIAVEDQPEISFFICQRTLSYKPIIIGFIYRIEFRRHSVDGVSVR